MLFFRNDYGEGCVEPILQALAKANDESHPGYGEDAFCAKAKEVVQSKMPDYPADFHFIASESLANIVMIKQALTSYEAIISCDTGHIVCHEAGAIEVSGHKILTVPNSDGKLSASCLRAVLRECKKQTNLYLIPKLVYISDSTELGTVYTRKELEEISAICKENDLYLMIDGARLGQALMSGVDYTLNDIARWADIFSLGITKNGGLFGCAIIVTNDNLKKNLRYVQKQNGGILAKSWLIGLQFIALFEHDDFYRCAKRADDLAAKIQDHIISLGYPLLLKSSSNQIFLVLDTRQYEHFSKKVDFEIWDSWDDQIAIRLVTSWHTSDEDVKELMDILTETRDIGDEEHREEQEEETASGSRIELTTSVDPQIVDRRLG
jgi:threonine aldolase